MKTKSRLLFLLLIFNPFYEAAANKVIADRDYFVVPNLSELVNTNTLICRYQSRSCLIVMKALVLSDIEVSVKPIMLRESWRPEAKLMMIANRLDFSLPQHIVLAETLERITLPQTAQQQIDLLVEVAPDLPLEDIEKAVFDTALPRDLKQWQNSLQNYPISTVPTMLYEGRYLINAEQSKTARRFLEILQGLKANNAAHSLPPRHDDATAM